MPVDDETAPETPAPEPTPPAADPTPAPSYVTQTELAGFADQLLGRISGMIEGISLAGRSAPPAAVAAEPTVDLGELDKLISSGEAGAAERVAQLINQRVEAATRRVISEHVDPLRTHGLGALEQLAKSSALAGKEHAKRFDAEITRMVAVMPLEVRGQPQAWQTAYDAVCGAHHDELTREAVERALRTSGGGAPPPSPSAPATLPDGRRLPTVEQVVGEEGMAALHAKGITDGDEFAQRLGYDSWNDYARVAVELESYTDDEYLTPRQRAAAARRNHARQ